MPWIEPRGTWWNAIMLSIVQFGKFIAKIKMESNSKTVGETFQNRIIQLSQDVDQKTILNCLVGKKIVWSKSKLFFFVCEFLIPFVFRFLLKLNFWISDKTLVFADLAPNFCIDDNNSNDIFPNWSCIEWKRTFLEVSFGWEKQFVFFRMLCVLKQTLTWSNLGTDKI